VPRNLAAWGVSAGGFDHNDRVHAADPPADDAEPRPAPRAPGCDEGGGPPPLVMGNGLDSAMPVVIFIIVNRLAGLPWAIAGATAWSLKAAVTRKRRGMPIGKFLPIITAGILLRGAIGIITDSEAVYFGLGIATKAGVGLVLIVTALIGRNLIAAYAPLVFGFDRATTSSEQYRSAMNHISIAAGCAQIISAAFDVWLFNNASVDGYLIIRMFVNWPFTTLVLFGSVAYLGHRLRELPGFPGMMNLLEGRMAQYEDSMRERKEGPT
jgi:hypothetical protein